MPRTRGAAETRALAASLAARLGPGDTIVLTGGLGAGKTTFVQGLASGLGIAERVQSPTFVLERRYAGRVPLVHVDLYRIEAGVELLEMGLDDALADDAVVAIEWGEVASRLLPPDRLEVRLEPVPGEDEQRDVTIVGAGRLVDVAAGLT